MDQCRRQLLGARRPKTPTRAGKPGRGAVWALLLWFGFIFFVSSFCFFEEKQRSLHWITAQQVGQGRQRAGNPRTELLSEHRHAGEEPDKAKGLMYFFWS